MMLKIYSTTEFQEVEVVWIEISTPEGSFVIQKNHAPSLFLLIEEKEFIYRYRTGKQDIRVLKNGGLLHVTRDQAELFIT